jgi:hypothetical protein
MEMKMDNFYEIMDLVYQINHKYPELRFGQIVDSLHNPNVENLFYLSDKEIRNRLEELVKTNEACLHENIDLGNCLKCGQWVGAE